jgi:microfibrillar-associated protein 1
MTRVGSVINYTRHSYQNIHALSGAGGYYMEKVKVSRYVSGKRPDYAPDSSDSEEDPDTFGAKQDKMKVTLPVMHTEAEKEDRRLRRLRNRIKEEASSDEEEDR